MICPVCLEDDSSVQRTQDVGRMVTRHRACKCGARWATHERIDEGSISVRPVTGSRPCPPVAGLNPIDPRSIGLIGATGDRPCPPVAVRGSPILTLTPSGGPGGVGGGLPSGSGSGSGSRSGSASGIGMDRRSSIDRSGPDRSARVIPDYSPGFLAFYGEYPRKVAKVAAYKAWVAWRCEGAFAAVMKGLRAQLVDFRSRPIDKVPHPATWLNSRRWEDQVPGAAAAGAGSTYPEL